MSNPGERLANTVVAMGDKSRELARQNSASEVSIVGWLREWGAFLRVRILFSIVATMVTGAALAAESAGVDGTIAAKLVFLIGIIVGAVILNQVIESESDRLMPRTSRRPIPAGRMRRSWAAVAGAVLTLAGTLGLLASGDIMLTVLGLAAWALYVAIYTPLKKKTSWQTPIGAVVGAAPVVLGAGLVDGYHVPQVWTLFTLIFFWQFPHAMAIATIYRDQFSQAGIQVAPVADPSGRLMRLYTLAGLAGLQLCVIGSVIWGGINPLMAVLLTIGTVYLTLPTLTFLRDPNQSSGRRLMRHTLVYLFLLILAFAVFRWFH
ncbi:MAG: protoheme IX farnesyltransferase [Thermogutta sp.]|jgi:protoheme IX farnesyltransferase